MLGTRHILPVLLGTLLLSAACQKIDEDMLNRLSSSGTNSETTPEETDFSRINSHVAILRSDSNVLYISLNEWSNVLSSLSSSPNQAKDIASTYQEGSMTGWRIPTKEEALAMKDVYLSVDTTYSDTLKALNKEITDIGGKPIRLTYRYLCSEADTSFSFKKGSAVTLAGAKVKYNLRLVKDSTITNVR